MTRFKIDKEDRVAAVGMLAAITWLVLMPVVACALFAGCKASYKGGRIASGTDAFVGLNMPMSDGVVQFEVLNYMSGFRYTFDQNAVAEVNYTETNETSFAGIWHNRYVKNFTARLEPTVSEPEPVATNEVEVTEEVNGK